MGKQSDPGKVRVIGGRWRGRKLALARADIRPTPDRLRETLFNWLTPYLRGARVLDLFAGSGALGIEAVSRGAATATLVELDRSTGSHLRRLVDSLDGDGISVVVADARRFLDQRSARSFDVVFLDPPYADTDLAVLCERLECVGHLSAEALIYIEMAATTKFPELPEGWVVLKRKTAGQACCALLQRQP